MQINIQQSSIREKLNRLLEEDLNHRGFHKETEKEALQLILHSIHKQLLIQHILRNQDSNIPESELTIEATIIAADKIATTNVKLPINTYASFSPFEVYVKDQYTHHNIDRYIKSQSHEKEAKKFLIYKYKWNTTTFHNIVWDHHSHIINISRNQ